MASNRVQKWIEHGEEVKANLAALIDAHLLVNSDGQPNLDETTDVCTDGARKRARKLTAVMPESQEQQKRDNENSATSYSVESRATSYSVEVLSRVTLVK